MKEEEEDVLKAQKIALHAAISTGRVDLYKRAQEISEKQAMMVIKAAQGENADEDKLQDIIAGELTDDEEFQEEVKHLAERTNSQLKQMKEFDANDSYFSEDEDDLNKDEIKKWQRETHEFEFRKGSFMTETEHYLMHSGFEERETKKADQLHLHPIDSKISRKMYNPKEIMKKIK